MMATVAWIIYLVLPALSGRPRCLLSQICSPEQRPYLLRPNRDFARRRATTVENMLRKGASRVSFVLYC